MPEINRSQQLKNSKQTVPMAAQTSTSAPVRHYRAWIFRSVLLIFAGGFAGLTFLVKTIPSFAIDLQITRDIQLINFPAFNLLMSLISWPGFSPQSILIVGLIILTIYGFGLKWEAMASFIGVTFNTGLNLLLKGLILRPRPGSDLVNVFAPLNDSSFPSGHVMFYLGFFGFLSFLAFSLMKPSIKRTLILVFLGGLVVLVGVSRIYLGQHWASDVLGAYLVGSLTLVLIIQFYLWGKTRFFVHQPAAPVEPNQV
jgi:membrane-associated phospholipid phosphatase